MEIGEERGPARENAQMGFSNWRDEIWRVSPTGGD